MSPRPVERPCPPYALRFAWRLPIAAVSFFSVSIACVVHADTLSSTVPGTVPVTVAPTVVASGIVSGSTTTYPSLVDPNIATSPFAGVVSIFAAVGPGNPSGFIGSGVAISSTQILTAGHVVDFSGGILDGTTSTATGDGIPDIYLPGSAVVVNNGPVSTVLGIQSVVVAPGWTGFDNIANGNTPSVHNDLSILTLSSPLPAGTPTYPLYTNFFENDTAKQIMMVGYGYGVDSSGNLVSPDFTVKRVGQNITGVYDAITGTETHAEVFLASFDDPNSAGPGLDGLPILAPGVESTLGPGDSGGPAFLWTDLNSDGLIEANELTLFGIDTFTGSDAADWPDYGSIFGGQIVSAYTDFIDGVPEPASLLIVSMIFPLLLRRRSRAPS